MSFRFGACAKLLAVALVACSSEGPGAGEVTSPVPTEAGGPGRNETPKGTEPVAQGQTPTAGTVAGPVGNPPSQEPSASEGACKDAKACGALTGVVKRTSTKPKNGGKGALYLAVFRGSPITDEKSAVVVARQVIRSVDLSADGAQVSYRLQGIPVAADEDYEVIAFLDDNGTATDASPVPDKGDLCSLQISGAGVSGVRARIPTAGDVALDIRLNVVMP